MKQMRTRWLGVCIVTCLGVSLAILGLPASGHAGGVHFSVEIGIPSACRFSCRERAPKSLTLPQAR